MDPVKFTARQKRIYTKAFRERDPRFDGKFFAGVKTTGIYCRPICPARPKLTNLEFYPTREAAESAGYRPCRRCRPETLPFSAAWLGKSAVVRRALHLLRKHPLGEAFNEATFAERFGVSARHLRRLVTHETGHTPQDILRERRLDHAYGLVRETGPRALPITEIALVSGFGSIRRFNDAFKARYHQNPRTLRRRPAP